MISAAFKLPETFEQIIPSVSDWINSLATDPVAVSLQNVFAQIEVVHILGLFALSSCVLLTSLRLLGVGLVEAPASIIYRNTRIWLHLGAVAAIASGLLMGFSNASKLYNNTAFLWKMIAMVAAIIFSYAVMAPTAKADGRVGAGAKIGLVIGLVVWALAFLIMQLNKGANVGLFHVLFAAVLLVGFALAGRMRWMTLALVIVIALVLQVLTHVIYKDPFTDIYSNINKIYMLVMTIFLVGVMVWNILARRPTENSTSLDRLIGYCSILAWVTVGAGGRWIGLT
jgi:hypothetical protein